MQDSYSLRTDLRLFTWSDTFLPAGNMSLYRVPLAARFTQWSLEPSSFSILFIKYRKLKARKLIFLFLRKKTKTLYITNYNNVFADSQENMSLRKFMVWHKS
jgi:hypothetical protein